MLFEYQDKIIKIINYYYTGLYGIIFSIYNGHCHFFFFNLDDLLNVSIKIDNIIIQYNLDGVEDNSRGGGL